MRMRNIIIVTVLSDFGGRNSLGRTVNPLSQKVRRATPALRRFTG
jgi:hypothetical protein